jgi:hypothetical protein
MILLLFLGMLMVYFEVAQMQHLVSLVRDIVSSFRGSLYFGTLLSYI